MQGRARLLGASTLATCALALAAGASLVATQGCLDRPVVPITPGRGGVVPKTIRLTGVDKVDMLIMIDNSPSMADKFSELGRRMPELIKALADPDVDPTTGKPKTQAVRDLHVGVITSSLGSHGTSVCDPATHSAHVDDHGHLLPRAADAPIANGYTVASVGGTPTEVACPGGLAAASAISWAFTAGTPAPEFSGTGQVPQTEAAISCVVQSAREDGCGYEAQLESIYHFLIDPAPYQTADAQCTKSSTGDNCGNSSITVSGVDQEILTERAAFLRPDSLLAVLMLTDENDGSIQPAALNWLPLAMGVGGMARGWKGCEAVPDDFEPQSGADYAKLLSTYQCQSCYQKGTDPGNNCGVPWATTKLNNDIDGRNERMLQHTRRYGFNFLWGRQRYVDAFSLPQVPGSDGKVATNPIYAGGQRTKDLVIVAGILGVPTQLLPKNSDGTPADLTEADWDKIVSPDLTKRDAHMIEQIAPRPGVAKFAGDRSIDPINGGDRDVASGDDLQYACIQQRNPSVANAPTTNPDCSSPASDTTNPLCGVSGGQPTQPYYKAYPTLRELRVIHELQKAQVPAFVASLCDSSYSPAIQGIINKLRAALETQCLKSILTQDPATGAVACRIVESFAQANPKGATKCEDLTQGGFGYCTPGAAPCRYATDSAGHASDYPPITAAEAASQLQLQITVVDATGALATQPVIPAVDPASGNVYATGTDGKQHLICEMMQIAGNPGDANTSITDAMRNACLHDPSFTLNAPQGGWCYATDAAVIGDKCIKAGAVGTIRFLGSVQPNDPGAEIFTLCVNG